MNFVAKFIAETIEASLKSTLKPLSLYLRGLVIGTLLIMASALALGLTILFGSFAIYTAFASITSPAVAALITAGSFALVSLFLILFGLRLLRPPR